MHSYDRIRGSTIVTAPLRDSWSGRTAFVLASIGAAVGLGNIWKFPYTAGTSGGGAFVVVYVLAILLIATPIMLSEMIIGRRTGRSAPTAIRTIAVAGGRSPYWSVFAWTGLLAIVLVLSFYSVIAGWTLAYFVKSVSGGLHGLSPAEVGASFGGFLAAPQWMTLWHLLFTVVTVFIVARGIRAGLERFVRVLMPALFVALVGLVIYAAATADFGRAFGFLFSFDFERVSPQVVLAAVGQAFFSLNVGVGSILTYAAYLPRDVNLTRSAIAVSFGDTVVALLAGLAVFPFVFAYDLNTGEGPGLIFVTLSTAFAQMPGGTVVGSLFFAMLFFAAVTSSISMLETLTARACEVAGLSRRAAAAAIGGATFLLGIVTVLSFSSWKGVHLLGAFETFAGKNPFDLMDYLVSNLLMPIGGMAYALFAGWWISRQTLVEEMGVGDGAVFRLWLVLARVLAPLAIGAVLVTNLA